MIEIAKEKEKSSHLIAIPVNQDGEPLTGFCPHCLGVNIYKDLTERDWKVWRMFRGLPYYCMDCRKPSERLASDYMPKEEQK
ncbi:MAG: hypothetical protein O8C58_01055 [Candidatus Methanoperedens sp.]|nr:hypothetical protein [Candidatus Methanoperedens sp.]